MEKGTQQVVLIELQELRNFSNRSAARSSIAGQIKFHMRS